MEKTILERNMKIIDKNVNSVVYTDINQCKQDIRNFQSDMQSLRLHVSNAFYQGCNLLNKNNLSLREFFKSEEFKAEFGFMGLTGKTLYNTYNVGKIANVGIVHQIPFSKLAVISSLDITEKDYKDVAKFSKVEADKTQFKRAVEQKILENKVKIANEELNHAPSSMLQLFTKRQADAKNRLDKFMSKNETKNEKKKNEKNESSSSSDDEKLILALEVYNTIHEACKKEGIVIPSFDSIFQK